MKDEIEHLLEEFVPEIEKEIVEIIPKQGIPNLNDAIWYHLETGGKRLRPILAIMTSKALGGDVKRVIPFAAACEMIHNWLLIHDDIEDGDVMRRNKETVWKKYGVDHGINIGDFMSAKVYELILKSKDLGVDESVIIRLLEESVKTCVKTAEGQTREMNLRKNNNPTETEYMDMVRQKTAYYLTLPIIGGAVITGAQDGVIEKIKEFGLKIGPAFQMTDDLLDLTEGKGRDDIGSDIKEGKRSVMVVHCGSKCEPDEKNRLFDILNKSRADTSKDDVLWVKKLFEKYGSIEYASKRSEELANESKGIISDTPSELRDILNWFAEYMIKRKK
jgi:geranylgeranyl diphosphate synthase type I